MSGVENFANSISVENTIGTGAPSGVTVTTDTSDPRYFIANIGNDFSAVISALDEQGDTTVLTNPRISVLNGQTALLTVGSKLDFISEIDITEDTTGTGTDEKTTKEYDVTTDSILSGVMLGLAPTINDEGEVTMTITPIISKLTNDPGSEATTFTAGGESFSVFLPQVDLKELSTIVQLKNGEMIVIGGHIDKKDHTNDKQVPFLGDLPFVGYLFKSHEKVEVSTELVIMLKTTVEM